MLRTNVMASRQSPPARSASSARRRTARTILRNVGAAPSSTDSPSPRNASGRNAVCRGGMKPRLEMQCTTDGRYCAASAASTTSTAVSPVPISNRRSPPRNSNGPAHGSWTYAPCAAMGRVAGKCAGGGLPVASTTSSASSSSPSSSRTCSGALRSIRRTAVTPARTISRRTRDGASICAARSDSSRYSPYHARGRNSAAVQPGRRRCA